MLAQTLSTDATPTPFNINSFISSLADDEGYLVNGDSAQFASGYLYAGSDQLVDKRDYIVGCTKHNDELDQILEDAFAAFNKNDMKTGTKKIQESGDPINQWPPATKQTTTSRLWVQRMLLSSTAKIGTRRSKRTTRKTRTTLTSSGDSASTDGTSVSTSTLACSSDAS